jgi:hypothetical protein
MRSDEFRGSRAARQRARRHSFESRTEPASAAAIASNVCAGVPMEVYMADTARDPAEVRGGLIKAFHDYEQKNERAWRKAS